MPKQNPELDVAILNTANEIYQHMSSSYERVMSSLVLNNQNQFTQPNQSTFTDSSAQENILNEIANNSYNLAIETNSVSYLKHAALSYELADDFVQATKCYKILAIREKNQTEKNNYWRLASACSQKTGDHFSIAYCNEKKASYTGAKEDWKIAAYHYKHAKKFLKAAFCYTQAGFFHNAGQLLAQEGKHLEAAHCYNNLAKADPESINAIEYWSKARIEYRKTGTNEIQANYCAKQERLLKQKFGLFPFNLNKSSKQNQSTFQSDRLESSILRK